MGRGSAQSADLPHGNGNGSSNGRSGNNRAASLRDAPAPAAAEAAAINCELESDLRPPRRVVVHRRSSSSSSTTIVVHNYQMKSSVSTEARARAPSGAGHEAASPSSNERASHRRPTNYAKAGEESNEAAAQAPERRPFSQANELPSSPRESASQRAVNQVRSPTTTTASAASARPTDKRQRPREQRQIMNNNNRTNWADSPTNYVPGRGRGRNDDNTAGATGNTSPGRWRRPDAASCDGADADALEPHNDDYSLIDTPDLHQPRQQQQLHSNGNHERELEAAPHRQQQHSASTQMNRSHFYNNLSKPSSKQASQQPELKSTAANGRARPQQHATMGASRRAKSATLPAGRQLADFGYDEVEPTRNANQQQRLNRQQVVAHGQAMRNDLLTSMKSPQRASIRLSGRQQNGASSNINGSSDSNSVAPYGSFGSASQRASRSSLSARSSRVGKFVNYYPASRQPASSAGQHTRATSPYAFHVPAHRLRSPPPLRSKSPASPQGYCPYGSPIHFYKGQPVEQYLLDEPDETYLVQRVAAGQQDEQNDFEQNDFELDDDDKEHLVAKAEIKQTRYGFVAPLDRVEARQEPLRKFNKSLKSRTIEHIPGMVQVSVDDNQLLAAQSPRLQSPSGDYLASSYNNRSEGDLLKAHRIVWRDSNKFEAGHDNPFKPGTELSLEADLMVRLIKRGYPIDDELPHLVQATKEVLAAKQSSAGTRSRSCDKLQAGEEVPAKRRAQKSAGFLNSNLCQFNEQALAADQQDQLDRGRALECAKHARPHSVSHSHLLASEKDARAVGGLEPCKRIWANSLSRAKSMPRFSYTGPKPDAGNKLKSGTFLREPAIKTVDDTDSLDKLISDIEREISDLLFSKPTDGQQSNQEVCENANGSGEALRQRAPPPRDIATTPDSSPTLKREKVKPVAGQQEQAKTLASSASTPSFATSKKSKQAKNDLTSSRASNELLLENPEGNSNMVVMKKKKSRCCLIQ